jgi:hypothetical protein
MESFDAEKYWGSREVKVWVVVVRSVRGGRETKYVRSRTKVGAGKTARENSFLKGELFTRSRLATPTDLGCN